MENPIELLKCTGADEELLRHILERRSQELNFAGRNVVGEVGIAVDRSRRRLAALSGRSWSDVQAVDVQCAVYDPSEQAIYVDVGLVHPSRADDVNRLVVHCQIRCAKSDTEVAIDSTLPRSYVVFHIHDSISARTWFGGGEGNDGIDLQRCVWIPCATLEAARMLR